MVRRRRHLPGFDRRLAAAWIAASALLFLPGIWSSRLPPPRAFRVPQTPVDLTWDRYARFWLFLKEARHHVPPGETYTVIAADREDEMYLYMFSLGLFEKQTALPSSYFGTPTADGARARYLLVYQSAPRTTGDRLVAKLENGAVYERTEMRP
ncbi:MAG TPA: hypothetical protein VJA66_01375 [Thermoanaerobaculia bacterium]